MQDGSATTTGEEMEQLFSYMSRLNITTKNMTAAGIPHVHNLHYYMANAKLKKWEICVFIGREEHITEAVRFWNKQKIAHMPKQLKLRLQKVHIRHFVCI